jgi:hypothetical protein
MKKKDLKEKAWYFIQLDGYDKEDLIPAQYLCECFLPAGLGDTSRDGIAIEEVVAISEEIPQPLAAPFED